MIELVEYAIYHKETALLHPLTLKIPKGEFFAVIGESGGGKTLLTKAILNLLPRELTETGQIKRTKEPMELVVQQPLDSLQRNFSIHRQFHHFLKSRGIKTKDIREKKFMNCLLRLVFHNQKLFYQKKLLN
ncbi:hypothetical protein BH747_10180 [Enterococcus villorum]|uniref:ABC transporter domain-containing protein n=2 Tax=Enterococcus villorum TaxID=112904 RepID=A0A1V8YMA6_9ENTE|nr:ATP-binding cassette domain-containing protein [Enterococcus villorum]EOH86139.1 hypothetical protein UAO_02524 [Enterococcus villorum ATCC 700913]EOW78787.1 hypothetical protein I591_00330 [Enterococcus villorum ATCC 700913]OQO69267.1 hypothetical protein BH747_10180 [Enterococcus villorum]OQO73742.1 hypothetical protein BH744_08950 [Enterococcus villorum]GEL92439.1 hypothetical protein EVI01_17760 [Enterococcus villorum]